MHDSNLSKLQSAVLRALALSAACALFAGVAHAQDPAAPGPFTVTATSYDFGDTAFTPSGGFPAVEVRAEVFYPSNLAAGPFPLVVFMHGRHATCYDPVTGAAGGSWPCGAGLQPIPSHEGYDYIGQTLASHGYVVVSVSANGINANDEGGFAPDAGMLARAELIQHHLSLWDTFSSTGGAPFGTSFVGAVDMQNVGTMGHSRGGEAAVRHYVLNQALGAPYGVNAVLPLAPTDFGRFVPSEVPLGVILPYCDGDVLDLQGMHYYDDALYAVPGDPARKHTFLVDGANHNFFNTFWTPALFAPGSIDDSIFLGSPHCAAGAPDRLSDTEQRAFGNAYITGFFRTYLGGETQFLDFLTGNAAPPPSALSPEVYPSFHAPDDPAMRMDVNRYALLADRTTNQLGGAVTETNLSSAVMCGGVELAQPPQCEPALHSIQQPHTVPSRFSTNRGLGQLDAVWTSAGASIENDLPAGSRDVSGYRRLTFRAAVNPVAPENTPGAPLDFSVVLVDGTGSSDSERVSSHSNALFFPEGAPPSLLPRLINNTVQIPLSAFAGVDLTDVRSVRFDFDQQSSGAVTLTDIAFSNPDEVVEVPLTTLVGEATTLPAPAGQMTFTAFFQAPAPVDLSTSTLTLSQALDETGTELVAGAPISLTPLPGATANFATYLSLLFPGATMTLTHLGGGLYFVEFTLFNESIGLPSACNFFFGGLAQLRTTLELSTAGSAPIRASVERQWACTPFGAFMLTF